MQPIVFTQLSTNFDITVPRGKGEKLKSEAMQSPIIERPYSPRRRQGQMTKYSSV